MHTPRLIACDVDGTLLDHLDQVTERTAAAVARVVASGTPFVLASGRPPRWIPSVARAAGIAGYAVCSNGAVVYDIGADRVVSASLLDPVLLGDVVHELDAVLPGCAFAVERIGEGANSLEGKEFLTEDNYLHPWAGDTTTVVPRAMLTGRPAVKLLIRHTGMASGEIAEVIEEVLAGSVAATYSTDLGLVEVAAPGVTKATGLAEVAERLDVASADVVAFGDMPNDVPMLRWAGLGVAMANGHPDALAAADEVTAANGEDGVAQVLDRWF